MTLEERLTLAFLQVRLLREVIMKRADEDAGGQICTQ